MVIFYSFVSLPEGTTFDLRGSKRYFSKRSSCCSGCRLSQQDAGDVDSFDIQTKNARHFHQLWLSMQ
jgi:hypothetical protein